MQITTVVPSQHIPHDSLISYQPKKKIKLTENQSKVIRDKYLRDGSSPEDWMRGVAMNIALSECLYLGRCSDPVEGVWSVQETKGLAAPMRLLHKPGSTSGERRKNFSLYLKNLQGIASSGVARSRYLTTAEDYYNLLSSFRFLPNSPTLMNAGRELQQLSACYVLPVEDSIEGIFDAVKAQAIIHKSGGGTGFSFGRLRPENDSVQSTNGIASGPVSFMKIFDAATEQVKQGGTRRGANMAILPWWHPDIEAFVTMKRARGVRVLENFNISVAIDEEFMDAVRHKRNVNLRNPRTGTLVRQIDAGKLFDLITECAWESGDPGYVVLDRINAGPSNVTPHIGDIESTNPCGEQPLLPNEPCNLGSLNLSMFITGDNGTAQIDWTGLRAATHLAIKFLDNVIDVNCYPTPEIERMAKGNRRIGLGVMGWAEMLASLRIPYASDEAAGIALDVMKTINEESLHASGEIAKERGVFPFWTGSAYDPASAHFRGTELRPRNCARTTIAPTGTIAIAAGLQGSGIEPFFAIAYTRYNAKGIDAIKAKKTPASEDTFVEVNPQFRIIAEASNFWGMSEQELWQKIEANGKSICGLPEIPGDIQAVFETSHDIAFERHIAMQAAFQRHTDNAVSKTINMPHGATVEDVRRAYHYAYDTGVKGLTIYRDGSKSEQVLNLTPATEEKAIEVVPVKEKEKRSHSGASAEYYEKETGYGSLHLNVVYDKNGPFRLFASLPPLGTEIAGLTAVLGILLSKYLESGGDPARIVKHLNSVKGDRPIGFGPNRVESIPHAVAQVMIDHLRRHGGVERQEAMPENAVHAGETCPKCFSMNTARVAGCSGPTCFDCGYSRCD